MLKSPVITNSWGVVAAKPRNEVNSSKNFPSEVEYFDDDGGRYMLKMVSFVRGSFRVTDEHSNDEKLGDEELAIGI